MIKNKTKLSILSLILTFNSIAFGMETLKKPAVRKGIQAFGQYGAAWGFGYNAPIGLATDYAAIATAENLNHNTFEYLRKKLPFIAIAAATYGAGSAAQYIDFDLLGPATGYATGLGLVSLYLGYEQLNSYLKAFKEGKLSWQKGAEVANRPEGAVAGDADADEGEQIIGDENV